MASARKDKEGETELHMRRVLEYEGFQVDRIASTSVKRADYHVSDDLHKYLAEVKRKEDDPVRIARFDQDFLENGEAARSEPGGRTSVMSGLIREAAKQLESTPTVPDEFKLIWFAAWGESPELQMDQFRSTLYGECRMLTARPQQGLREIPCYYYTFNEFLHFLRKTSQGAISFTSRPTTSLIFRDKGRRLASC
jgi:hypothetical protein